ncbi:MAG: rod shape-determining protein MreD [Rhodospirillaceae bacterium]|nr:rod shape-determining protein MreD [Rhodospirillaceae bacterium]MBT5264841.1 rod shape-determining protein MreD [Rhodospirillaceae bacterium]MBT5414853.1 rod shape-determining protein MreD [Rhodospirillaceae bacterium]
MTTVLFVVLSCLPIPLPGVGLIAPAIALMAVYYWSIQRPELLPPVAVFIIGFVQDALSGGVLGLSPFVFLLVHALVVSQRRFFLGKSFLLTWWGFSLVAVGAELVLWILASLVAVQLIDPEAMAVQTLLTVALFPCVSWLLVRVHRAFLASADA